VLHAPKVRNHAAKSLAVGLTAAVVTVSILADADPDRRNDAVLRMGPGDGDPPPNITRAPMSNMTMAVTTTTSDNIMMTSTLPDIAAQSPDSA
jgi:hypothetical protein